MQNVWALASLWVGLALIATLIAIWLKIVATVIGSAVIPTMFANAWFMPEHLLPKPEQESPAKEVTAIITSYGRKYDGPETIPI
jgi:hypothetical protein